MKLQVATLCDAASVRENLLHVLGAGISKMIREEFPTNLDTYLAVLVDIDGEVDGLVGNGELRVALRDDEGKQIAGVNGKFTWEADAGEHVLIPMPLALGPIRVAEPGRYCFEIDLNGQDETDIHFEILLAETLD